MRYLLSFYSTEALKFHIVVKGVETVRADSDASKLTITGNLDPSKLRDKLAEKTKKKVDLVSPQPKKDNKDAKADKKKPDDKPDKKNPDDKKSKEVNLSFKHHFYWTHDIKCP